MPPIGSGPVIVPGLRAVWVVAVITEVVTGSALGLVVAAVPGILQAELEVHGLLRDPVVTVQTHGRGNADLRFMVLRQPLGDRHWRAEADQRGQKAAVQSQSSHGYIPNPAPPSIIRLCAVTPLACGLAR
ncbi:hypothetical protein D9M71_653720 [compost metagenome]